MNAFSHFLPAACAALLQITLVSPAFAVWPDSVSNQLVINNESSIIEIGSVSDGTGGAIIVYHDYNAVTGRDLKAQRFDSAGNTPWGSAGLVISNALGSPDDVRVVPRSDGCFVIWTDSQAGSLDVYAQRITNAGQLVFPANGLAEISGAGNTRLEHAISDGQGGFIIAYNNSLYLQGQRFNEFGANVWSLPTVISDTSGDRVGSMISDGSSGAFVGLERAGIGAEVAIVHVSSTGDTGQDALLSQNATGDQSGIQLARQTNGHVLAVWYKAAANPSRFVSTDFVSPLVTTTLVPLNTGPTAVSPDFRLIESTTGDPLMLYGKVSSGDNYDAYLARVSPSGQLTLNVKVPDDETGSQTPDNLIETTNGDIKLTYKDTDPGVSGSSLVAARFTPLGENRWANFITPLDGSFASTDKARLVEGSQSSLIVFSKQAHIPGATLFGLIRLRNNGTTGGEVTGPDMQFQTSYLDIVQKNRKGTLLGELKLENSGTDLMPPATLRFFLSPGPNFDPATASFLFDMEAPALQAGETLSIEPGLKPPKKPGKKQKIRKIKLPKGVIANGQYLIIQADPANTVEVSDETNNQTAIQLITAQG